MAALLPASREPSPAFWVTSEDTAPYLAGASLFQMRED